MSKQKQSGLPQADKALKALENAGPRAKQLSNSFLRGIMSGNTPPQKMVKQLNQSAQGTQLEPFMKQMTATTKSDLEESKQNTKSEPQPQKPKYKRGAHGAHQSSGSVEISSIHVHNTDVMFDETVDVYFYAKDQQYDDLSWEYTWSGGHSETVKVDQPADSIQARLRIPDTKAIAGDKIHIDATVRDPSGDTDKRGITLNIIGEKMAAVDVWFDTEDAQQTQRVDLIGSRPPPPTRRRRDPIIFDLDRDGEIGMGGKNIEGDGSLDGDTVLFDMAPGRSSWAFVSSTDVPGEDAPRLRNGYVIYENGDKQSIGSTGVWRPPTDSRGRFQHPRAKLYNANNQWVMEWVRQDDDGYDLFWGSREDKELTVWLKKGSFFEPHG